MIRCMQRDLKRLKKLDRGENKWLNLRITYQQYIDMQKIIGLGGKLVLYGFGAAAKGYYELEKRRRGTVGYLYVPFFGDIDWHAIGDRNSQNLKILYPQIAKYSWEEMLEADDENTVYYIGTPDYYDEIKKI